MKCIVCDYENSPESEYCEKCGSPMRQIPNKTANNYNNSYPRKLRCPYCRSEIVSGQVYCNVCQKPISAFFSNTQMNRAMTNSEPTTVSYQNPDYMNRQNNSYIQPMKNSSYNIMCIIGFAMSMVSLFLNFLGLVSIAGTILSIVGVVQCGKSNEKGKGFAIAGIIIGIISILLYVIVIVLLASGIFWELF